MGSVYFAIHTFKMLFQYICHRILLHKQKLMYFAQTDVISIIILKKICTI